MSSAEEYNVTSLEDTLLYQRKRAFDLFQASEKFQLPILPQAYVFVTYSHSVDMHLRSMFCRQRIRVASRILDDYKDVALPPPIKKGPPPRVVEKKDAPALIKDDSGPLLLTDATATTPAAIISPTLNAPILASAQSVTGTGRTSSAAAGPTGVAASASTTSSALTVYSNTSATVNNVVGTIASRAQPKGITDPESLAEYKKVEELSARVASTSRALAQRRNVKIPEPKWHSPWKLMRVISGHNGWVRAVSVDPSNEWFATGSADRTIKIWDLASGTLKVTFTGHINTIRGLAVSHRSPYLFSAGEDKQVKCWDLETNKVIRQYSGHLSGVQSLALHPTLDLLMTGGRDATCRVWDIRTKAQVHVLGGHENSVSTIATNAIDPQVVTGSMDSTIRTWDLVAGKVMTVLTHHKKAVRSIVNHPTEFAMLSAGADNIKKWALPDGVFVSNFSGHNSIVNALALNHDNVVVSGGDDGSMKFWDYETGYCFQSAHTRAQAGSLESENGIYAMTFDMTGRYVFDVAMIWCTVLVIISSDAFTAFFCTNI